MPARPVLLLSRFPLGPPLWWLSLIAIESRSHSPTLCCHLRPVCVCVRVWVPALLQVAALYGDQPGHGRARVLAQFNQGELHALATSDAFGLGLDYKDVDVVLCLDDAAPTAQAYVARCGRGRLTD